VAAAPIAEKAVWLAVGILSRAFDPCDTGGGKTRRNIAFDIKLIVTGFAVAEKPRIFGVGIFKTCKET
jgi:hypothetical protein